MGSLRLYAIAIDEVRDIFCAPGDIASTLRAVAAEKFASSGPAAPGLLGKLGPVFRRAPDAPVVRPGVPSGSDVEDMLAGLYVAPHRLSACWALLEAWIAALAWGSIGKEFTKTEFNEFDFDLARAAVPARYGVLDLVKTDLGIAMMTAPGLAAGYVRREHALAMAEAWRSAIGELGHANRSVAGSVLSWLDGFPGWTAQAAQLHRQPPDLVAILRA